jgi:hypothetical protein
MICFPFNFNLNCFIRFINNLLFLIRHSDIHFPHKSFENYYSTTTVIGSTITRTENGKPAQVQQIPLSSIGSSK